MSKFSIGSKVVSKLPAWFGRIGSIATKFDPHDRARLFEFDWEVSFGEGVVPHFENELEVATVRHLREDQVVVGLRIRAISDPTLVGVVCEVDKDDDSYAWVIWGEETVKRAGFYWNHCDCELV